MKKYNSITFNMNGIKVDGKHIHGNYSLNDENQYARIPKNTIVIYLDTYHNIQLPGLIGDNESDIMTDYFEKTTLYITPNNRYYKEAKIACDKCLIKQYQKEINYLNNLARKHPKNAVIYETGAKKYEKKLAKLMKCAKGGKK